MSHALAHDPHRELALLQQLAATTSRRRFMQWAGVSFAVVLTACGESTTAPIAPTTPSGDLSLGTGDNGVLNYAYALEQLEAAYYTQVVATPYTGISALELTLLTDIKLHEVVHRDFLKAALGAAAIGALEVDFTSVDFTSRASVLGTAKVFEDLGVAAYNGAGQLFTDANLLLIAGKIVSVEARHAAIIRNLLNPKSADFAGDDVVNPTTGLDRAFTPAMVLTAADPFVKTEIDFSTLPTN